ncbi:hydrogenase maturation nickel metallochaperone HypA [Lutibacter sp. TH_r2]|uniref:hydrogenase maturation nickel metallochaperone HypA n=1 Tax=Lutibacter sp. TH_r2 TaxID=3082083 RepID=UPI0029557FCB|nr:hydrogenase maturation nickel metallochaperone HypA [Lutibacter sp. TH_r2]MDV7186223.1 hydrogenase maturation nickel metallochaperone HypA [Lutibacter sp. TH_r2]
MHELSIAMDIVRITEDETSKANATEAIKIELEVGVLSGIELDALKFVWPSAVKDSVLEKAELEIIEILGKGKCKDCNTEFDMENIFDVCPKCSSNFKDIIQGKELRVKTLEVI